jgi:hypothetical protein
MSDGPWKTLEMSRDWRRVARFAEMDASSSKEVAQKMKQALTGDSREIPTKLKSDLRKAFGDGRQQVLGFNEHEKLVAPRSAADGSPLGALLVSYATVVANEGYQGDAALREAVIRTLQEWATYGAKQVEEHHYREAADGRATDIRNLIESAATLIDWVALANQVLGIDPTPARRAAEVFTGIEDGPSL